MAKTQREKIRNHIVKHGDITRLVAFNIYKVIDLRKIISDLRKSGMPIKTTSELDDTGYRFTRYVLDTSNAKVTAA